MTKKKKAAKKVVSKPKPPSINIEKFFEALLSRDEDESGSLCDDARDLIRKCVRIAKGEVPPLTGIKTGQLWELDKQKLLIIENDSSNDYEIEAFNIQNLTIFREMGDDLKQTLRDQGKLLQEDYKL